MFTENSSNSYHFTWRKSEENSEKQTPPRAETTKAGPHLFPGDGKAQHLFPEILFSGHAVPLRVTLE